jgi:hypothetical protein
MTFAFGETLFWMAVGALGVSAGAILHRLLWRFYDRLLRRHNK